MSKLAAILNSDCKQIRVQKNPTYPSAVLSLYFVIFWPFDLITNCSRRNMYGLSVKYLAMTSHRFSLSYVDVFLTVHSSFYESQ